MSLFVNGFFHLAQCFQGSNILCPVSVLHSFSLLNNIPSYGYTTFLSIHQLRNIWAVSTFLGTFNNITMDILILALVCSFVFIFPDYIPRSGLTGSYSNSVFNTEELPDYLPKRLYHFTFPPAMLACSTFFSRKLCVYIYNFNIKLSYKLNVTILQQYLT